MLAGSLDAARLVTVAASAGGIAGLPASWPSIGAGGLLAIVVLTVFRMVIRGQLVPGNTHRRELAAEQARTKVAEAERDKWQDVALKAMGQNSQLLSTSSVTEAVVRAMPKALHDPDAASPGESP